jgi:hypothetical protein
MNHKKILEETINANPHKVSPRQDILDDMKKKGLEGAYIFYKNLTSDEEQDNIVPPQTQDQDK